MNDCVNAEFRDQLPALLHERLEGSERAAILAHLDGCLDCREELELLRELQGMFVSATPAVSLTTIVAALPAAPLPAGVLPFRQRVSRRMDWRVAAAVLVLVAGGGSFAMRGHMPSAAQAIASATPTVPTAVAVNATPTSEAQSTVASATVASNASRSTDAELSMTGRLDDLSDEQLQSLLGEIDNLQATTIAEPEAAVVPVTLSSDGPSGA